MNEDQVNEENVTEDQDNEEKVTEEKVNEEKITEDKITAETSNIDQVAEEKVTEDEESEDEESEDEESEDEESEDEESNNQVTETEDPIESDTYTFKFLTQIQDILLKVQSNVVPQLKKYALYFIALEDDNMFLHLSYKKSNEQILYQCEQLYEYTKLFKPLHVVYTMDNCDLTDADKYVKVFMKMFGEDSTRGGSYTDIILPDWQKKILDFESETASLEKLDEIDAMFDN